MSIKPKVYIVAGTGKAGKSTTICHLTGMFWKATGKTKLVDSNGNVMDVYVRRSSAQEYGISPKEFIDEVKTANLPYVMLALRTDKKQTSVTSPSASATTFIEEFMNKGWSIEFVAELNNGNVLSSHSQAKKYKYKTFQWANCTNQLADEVRKFFNLI